MLVKRYLQSEILQRIHHYPVVGIIGSRQIGKTTLAKQIIPHINKETIYLDLESIADYQKLENPELYLEQHKEKCVIIDEVQNKPDLFPILRSIIDKDRKPGRFIILGSASPEMLRQSSESLAGRISYIQLHPFNLYEIFGKRNLYDHWFIGGFPLALLNSNTETAKQWIDDFIKSYSQRDLPALGLSANPIVIQRLWMMLAHLNSQVLNYSEIGRSMQISSPTIKTYIDFFESSFLIKRLQPFYFNIKKRIIKSPKIYISDTGVLHRLLNIFDFESLQAFPIIGNSWESYVVNQVIPLLNTNIELYYYRTKDGSELDLVFVKSLKPIATAEIKYTSSPSLSTGNTRAINTLATDINFIITPASEDYFMRGNVRVCCLFDFLKKHLPEIK